MPSTRCAVSPKKFSPGNLPGTGSGPSPGTVVRRNGVMTHIDVFDLLDHHLARCGDETAGLALLVALAPALRRLAGRLVRMGIEREEAEQRTVAACWTVLVRTGFEVTVDRLLGQTWSLLRTEVRRDLRRRAVEQMTTGHAREPADPGAGPGDRLCVLADARRAGALTRRQAALLYEIRVLDRPIQELAEASGRSRAALWKEGQRATVALRRFLVDDSASAR